MSSRVNQAYKQYHREMVSGTLKGHLSISKLVEDFKLPEPPKDPAEDILKGLAFGKSNAHYHWNIELKLHTRNLDHFILA